MEAYLICGLSCTGQTSVGLELKRRGYDVIDTDESFAYWANLETEEPVEFPDLNNLTENWFNINGWVWNRKRVEDTFRSNNRLIFFCGSSDKDPEYFSRFKYIFRLYVDSETLKKRLTERNYNLHNTQFYINRQLLMLQDEEKYANTYNMFLINTAQYSVKETVHIILEHIDSLDDSSFKLRKINLIRIIRSSIYKAKIFQKIDDKNASYESIINITKRALKLIIRNILYSSNKKNVKRWSAKNIYFGNLRRLNPISRSFGYDLGLPIDRFYIEKFLAKHAKDIYGYVLEIKDPNYTKRFGGDRVIQSDVLHITEGNPNATIIGDLTNANHIPSESFNSIILTQTLHIVYDLRAALSTLYRILKTGGVLLVTVPGISQVVKGIGDNDYNWAFTNQSARLLFEEYFEKDYIQVENHGNVLTAIAFLHGIPQEELTKDELLYKDDEYQVIITIRAVKPT